LVSILKNLGMKNVFMAGKRLLVAYKLPAVGPKGGGRGMERGKEAEKSIHVVLEKKFGTETRAWSKKCSARKKEHPIEGDRREEGGEGGSIHSL